MSDRATELFEKEAAMATKSIVSGIVKLLILFAALFFLFSAMVRFIGGAAFGATNPDRVAKISMEECE